MNNRKHADCKLNDAHHGRVTKKASVHEEWKTCSRCVPVWSMSRLRVPACYIHLCPACDPLKPLSSPLKTPLSLLFCFFRTVTVTRFGTLLCGIIPSCYAYWGSACCGLEPPCTDRNNCLGLGKLFGHWLVLHPNNGFPIRGKHNTVTQPRFSWWSVFFFFVHLRAFRCPPERG